MRTRRLVRISTALICAAAILTPIVIPSAAAAQQVPTLAASPNPALAGTPVVFTFKLPTAAGTTISVTAQYQIDFGDAPPRLPIQPNASAVHVYARAGTYTAVVYATTAFSPRSAPVAQSSVTITARTAPATPPPPPTPPPATTPPPSAALHVIGTSATWPDGSQRINLHPNESVPGAVGLVRVDAAGSVVVQWRLDGKPLATQFGSASQAGSVRFDLRAPLPPTGEHVLSLVVVSPSYVTTAPIPQVAYAYATGGAPSPPPAQYVGWYNGPPPVVKFPVLSTKFTQGVIELLTPRWGSVQVMEGEFTDIGVPVLDDATSFTWQEQNPGTAAFFELRILDGSGKVLASVQTGAKTDYVPDPAFLEKVLAAMGAAVAGGTGGLRMLHAGSAHAGQSGGGTPSAQDAEFRSAAAYWQVAGFDVDPQVHKPYQVEISDRWPLNHPDRANGLGACSAQAPLSDPHNPHNFRDVGRTTANLVPLTVHHNPQNPSVIDPNHYVGDDVGVQGNVDLTRSPYLSQQPKVTWDPTPPPQPNQLINGWTDPSHIRDVAFDDIYVDWGDGEIDPLHGLTVGVTDGKPAWPTNTQNLPGNLPSANQRAYLLSVKLQKLHPYMTTGVYAVRLFQIAESDAQRVSGSELSAYDSAGTTSPYLQTMRLASFGGASQASGPTVADVAGRAYMVTCIPWEVRAYEDLAADGPLHLISVRVTLPDDQSGGKPVASTNLAARVERVSSCDQFLTAKALLRYYGSGHVRVVWRVDGKAINGTGPPDGALRDGKLSSPARSNLPPPGSSVPTPAPIEATLPLESPLLPVSPKDLGNHTVTAEVDVAPEPAAPDEPIKIVVALGALAPGGKIARAPQAAASAASAYATIAALTSAPRVGYLAPTQGAVTGMPAVAYVPSSPQALARATGMTPAAMQQRAEGPPNVVKSAPRIYQVTPSDPKTPCVFAYGATYGGKPVSFTVGDLQGHVKQSGGAYSGRGRMDLKIFESTDGAASDHVIDVPFSNWKVDAQGLNVTAGALDAAPKTGVAPPGTTGTLDRLHDDAPGNPMQATMSLALADQTLTIAGSQRVPSWPHLQAPIDPDGDWLVMHQKLPAVDIGYSAFQVAASDVSFHFADAQQGAPTTLGPGCGSAGPGWHGILLSSATIAPYLLDLKNQSGTGTIAPPTPWVIGSNGLCGAIDAHLGFHATLAKGTVDIPEIKAGIFDDEFSAEYDNMNVHVPWLDTDLHGTATLVWSEQHQSRTGLVLAGLKPPTPQVVRSFGNVKLTVSNLQFTLADQLGWIAEGDTHYDFSTKSKPFTSFDVAHTDYTMDGHAAFDGRPSADLSLGGGSYVGAMPVDLKSVHLDGSGAGSNVLAFTFQTIGHLSPTLPAPQIQMNYTLPAGGSDDGPYQSPFSLDKPFPDGSQSTDSGITPDCDFSDPQNLQCYGDVQTSLFGGQQVNAEFRLGLSAGNGFWGTRAAVPLSSAGVPIVPGIMNLYAVKGGLAYHLQAKSLATAASLKDVPVDLSSDLVFFAGADLGSTDGGFAYYVEGDLTISAQLARMDYAAWLAQSSHAPNSAQLDGYFQYAGGNFDGGLEGQFSLPAPLGQYAYLRIPGPRFGGAPYAANLHFGSGDWHVYIGQKQGPRVQLHLIVVDADGFVMLSNQGIDLGADEHLHLGIGDSSVVSAYIDVNGDVEVIVTPQPHFAGDFAETVDAGACIAGGCFGASVGAQIHAEAVPLDVDASAEIGTPWPLPDINVHVHL